MSKAVVEPPTNASSPRSGFKRRAASINICRLRCGMDGPQSFNQLMFGYFPFARTTVANRINESQQFIETKVFCGSKGSCFIERLESDASNVSVWPRPYWGQLITGGDFIFQWRGCIGGGNTASY